MDLIGVQQVLSLSSAAEKVQQTTQQRGDIVNYNAVTSKEDQDVEHSKANPPSELTQEARFNREKEKQGGGRNTGKLKKKSSDKEEDTEVEAVASPSDCGHVLDVIV